MKKSFDGDTLNILLLINNEIKRASNAVFNPRNAMHISRNDGLMEPFFNHKKDTMILTNALINTTKGYTKEEYDLFDMCRNWKDQIKK